MRRLALIAALGGILGLVVGYALFASIGGVRLGLDALISFERSGELRSVVRRATETIVGIDRIRRNILISGGVGAVVCVIGALFGRWDGVRRRARRK